MSSGRCRSIAAAVFTADDQGWVSLRDERPPQDQHEAVLDAAVACPTGSIEVLNDDGSTIWP